MKPFTLGLKSTLKNAYNNKLEHHQSQMTTIQFLFKWFRYSFNSREIKYSRKETLFGTKNYLQDTRSRFKPSKTYHYYCGSEDLTSNFAVVPDFPNTSPEFLDYPEVWYLRRSSPTNKASDCP